MTTLAGGTRRVLESIASGPMTRDEIVLAVYAHSRTRTLLHQRIIERRLKTLFDLDMAALERRPNGRWSITGHGMDWLRAFREKKRRRK